MEQGKQGQQRQQGQAGIEVFPSFYRKEGVCYDRLTKVLDFFQAPELIAWKVKTGQKEIRRIQSKALKMGTLVHGLIHEEFKEGAIRIMKSVPKEVLNCLTAYKAWKVDWTPKIKSMEQTHFDELDRVGCTYDMELEDTLVELKTSKYIDKKYWIQLAVNNEVSRLRKPYVAVLRLDKEMGLYDYQRQLAKFEWLDVFDAMLKVYRFMKPDRFEGQDKTEREQDEHSRDNTGG